MVLRAWVDGRMADVHKKEIAEGCQVLVAIEMLKHVLASRPAKWAESGFRLMDQLYSRHKVFRRTRAIEKTILPVQQQFRDAGDRGCQHGPAVRHGFHQDQRNTLAAAGEHDQVGS